MAIDGAGNLYVVDQEDGGSAVVELPFGTTQQTDIYESEDTLAGIAVDGGGTVYVSDPNASSIFEILASGVVQTPVNGDAGLNNPAGLALDAAGDLFIADSGNNRIVELPAGGGDLAPVATGLAAAPVAVAVDAAGNLYITESGGETLQTSPSGVVENIYGNGLGTTLGVALDGLGNVYLTTTDNAASVIEYQRSVGSSLTFGDQRAGTASAAQIFGVQNSGNQPLTFSAISAGTNTAIDAATTTCATTANVAVGAACNLGVEFSPPAGATIGAPLNGTVTLADNAPNSPQAVSLTGTATLVQAAQTIAFTPIATQNYGAATFAVTATASSGLAVTISVQSGPATVANNQVTVNGVGTVVLAGSQAGNADYLAATATTSFSVVPAATSIALSVNSNVVRTPNTISLSATVSSAATGESGTVTFLDGSAVLGQSALSATDTAVLNGVTLAVGSHNITASYAGATDFAASTSTAANVVVEPLAAILNTIAPTLAEAGSSDTTITATGADFSPTAVVNFNGTPLATTFVSATQLTAVIPAAQLATAGTINVTVTDTYSTSTSGAQTFTILPAIAVTFTGPPTSLPGRAADAYFPVAAALCDGPQRHDDADVYSRSWESGRSGGAVCHRRPRLQLHPAAEYDTNAPGSSTGGNNFGNNLGVAAADGEWD